MDNPQQGDRLLLARPLGKSHSGAQCLL